MFQILIEKILTLIGIAGLITLFVEVWVMKSLSWGTWLLCLGDAVLLNFLTSLTFLLVYSITHSIFPSWSIPSVIIIPAVISFKTFLAYKFSDRPWFIVLVSTIASFIGYTIALQIVSRIINGL